MWKGYNDLATIYPELAAQWNYGANKGLIDGYGRDISTPDKITINSNQEVSWIIDVFDKDSGETFPYSWKATVCDRLKTKTPFYIGSKGEMSVRNTLIDNRVKFKEQNTFPDRIGLSNRPLKDDFAIFDKSGSIIATIEFNGEHHYRPVDFAGKGQEWAKAQFEAIQKRDKIKSDYLRERNIKQLIVPYTEFENVEEIVNDFIEELSKDFDLQHSKEDEKEKVWAPPKARINQKAVAEFTKEILTKYRNDQKPATKQEKVCNSKRNDIAIDI